ncbi:hypothetical protein BJQ89_03384 [Arthrobacter sp. ES1]|nr:hypothetical protein [Arthrobacter sp. ES1]
MSTVSTSSASHTTPKPIQRSVVMGSWNTASATMNCSTGAKYCSRPMVVIGRRLAEAPKNSNGTAVMMPEAARSQKCPDPLVVSVAAPVSARTIKAAAATGASTIVSIERLVIASTRGPTRFLTKPYRPKLSARVNAIHGSLP